MKQGTPRLTPQGVVWENETDSVEKPEREDVSRRIQIKTEFQICDGSSDSRGWAVVAHRPGHVLWITALWVHPEDRKKGWASALLNAVINEYGAETLYLEVAPYADRPLGADALAAFYGRFGFESTSVPGVLRRPPDR